MKSYGNLLTNMLSDSVMDKALQNASKSKRKRKDVQEVIENKEQIKHKIRHTIITGNYEYRCHKAKYKEDGINKKQRIVVQPFFQKDYPEQWMQHILIEGIKPVLLNGMYFHSFGSVPKKGVHKGKHYLEKNLYHSNQKYRYSLKIDISKFYSNIDTEVLKNKFRKVIREKEVFDFICWCIDNNECKLPDGTIMKKGVTIGGYPSQFFANFYLQDFDHWLKEEMHAKYYIRYMDDMVVLDTNKRHLHRLKRAIESYLAREGLTLKGNYQVFKLEHFDKRTNKTKGRFIDFMGFKFHANRVAIRKQIFYRSTRLAARMAKAPHLTVKNACRIVSYLGWYKVTKSRKALEVYITSKVDLKACRKLISKASKRRNHEYNLQKDSKQHKTA